ncbi:hypothetical protein FACS1894159_03980 [Bacteroidia bacterium]|nr:hypothetical protein FACS1894159_03980 [Bacteroidia bacterium]
MKNILLYLLILSSSSFIFSCTTINDDARSAPEQSDLQISSDEEKAVETFNRFLDMLNSSSKTRASVADARVASVRKTSSGAYSGTPQTRSGDAQGLAMYELTLENPDNSKGFAVVADPAFADQVIAYAPVGSLADTTYNLGLAMYLKEFAMLLEAPEQVATRTDYWQPNWQDIFPEVPGTREFVRWLEPYEYGQGNGQSWIYSDPIDYTELNTAYVPTRWDQENPYNNLVPYYVSGTSKRVRVGCASVAIGQIMAFHQHPSTYNWSLLTQSPTIPPWIYITDGENQLEDQTPAQAEVAQLLHDIATAAGTDYDTEADSGGTDVYMVVPALNAMGYSGTYVVIGSATGLATLAPLREEIITHQRPFLFCGQTHIIKNGMSVQAGHIWVVDAIWTYERWGYISFWQYGGEHHGQEGLDRYRTQCNMLHCNWGWGGQDNGWYYNYSPPKIGGARFYFGKTLITGIVPL